MNQLNLFDVPEIQPKEDIKVQKTVSPEDSEDLVKVFEQLTKLVKKPIGKSYTVEIPVELESRIQEWSPNKVIGDQESIICPKITHGWLLPALQTIDLVLQQRWVYWIWLQNLPKARPDLDFTVINEELWYKTIGSVDFPKLRIEENANTEKMLMSCITATITALNTNGMSAVEFFLDWLLYGFGYSGITTLPQDKKSLKASAILYQLFCLELVIRYPSDYMGNLISEIQSSFGRSANAFYPTPINLATIMNDIVNEDKDLPSFGIVSDHCAGTGVLPLSASDHHLRGDFIELNLINAKACLFQFYCYAPWFARPITWLGGKFIQGNALSKEVYSDMYNLGGKK